MKYFFVTTCLYLFPDYDIRKSQYTDGITRLINYTKNIENSKIIIIENNGKRNTFLDDFGVDVFYTENNNMNTLNKGLKEIKDILECIHHYQISDTDFIVKMTGRYLIEENNIFINIIKNIDINKIHCVIKYGCYKSPVDYKCDNCITGLIGMLVKYIKLIKIPGEKECVEWCWAKNANLINSDNIILIQGKIGIQICPASNSYFLV